MNLEIWYIARTYFCVIHLEDNSFFILDVLFETRINEWWTNIFDNIFDIIDGVGGVIAQTVRGRCGKWMYNIFEVLFKLAGPLKRQHFLIWVKTTSYKYRLPNGCQSDQTKLLHLIFTSDSSSSSQPSDFDR